MTSDRRSHAVQAVDDARTTGGVAVAIAEGETQVRVIYEKATQVRVVSGLQAGRDRLASQGVRLATSDIVGRFYSAGDGAMRVVYQSEDGAHILFELIVPCGEYRIAPPAGSLAN